MSLIARVKVRYVDVILSCEVAVSTNAGKLLDIRLDKMQTQ